MILLTTAYLLSATETGELLKLPLLADHYYDHKTENDKTGLIPFLIQHYSTEDGTDKDAAEDRQLPFKSAENSSSTAFISSIPPAPIHIIRPETIFTSSFVSCYNVFIPSSTLAAIWQPPRYS